MSARGFTAFAYGKISKTMQRLVYGDGDLTERLEEGWNAGMAAITPNMMPTEDTQRLATSICSHFREGRFVPERSSPSTIADQIWLLYDKLSRNQVAA